MSLFINIASHKRKTSNNQKRYTLWI